MSTAIKVWKSVGGAVASATRMAAQSGETFAIYRGHTSGYAICPVTNLGPDRAKRAIGIISTDGVFTEGRVTWPM